MSIANTGRRDSEAPAMHFNFRLKAIEAIEPWHTTEGQATLSWFALTDGWFWIEVAGQELFRYSRAALDFWQQQDPGTDVIPSPYTDYQVARYWEDLLQMLPVVLDPLPSDLATRVADAEGWRDWLADAERCFRACDDDSAMDRYQTAVGWWQERTWDASHLAQPPRIWLWRVGDALHIRWDNRGVTIGDSALDFPGLAVWDAARGECSLSCPEFLAAVTSFNDRFLSEMGWRVQDATAAWPNSAVLIDVAALRREQMDRAGWLAPTVAPFAIEARRAFSWEEVRSAMAALDLLIREHQGAV